jgi:cytochrome c biogenesis factor
LLAIIKLESESQQEIVKAIDNKYKKEFDLIKNKYDNIRKEKDEKFRNDLLKITSEKSQRDLEEADKKKKFQEYMYKKNTEHQIMVNTMKEGDHVVHSSDEEQNSPRDKK